MSVDSKLLEEEAEVELQYTDKKPSTRKRKLNQKLDNNGNVTPEKLVKRIKLFLTKPSTLLVLAPTIGSKVVRWENRVRLSHLLRKLVKRRNWVEVGGVLSMLLKASCKDRYPLNNRFKYSVRFPLCFLICSFRNSCVITCISDHLECREQGTMMCVFCCSLCF